jgi:hypothetical protein
LLQEPKPSNLKELSLANCKNISPGVVKTIAQIDTLESVDLSHCTQLTVRSPSISCFLHGIPF